MIYEPLVIALPHEIHEQQRDLEYLLSDGWRLIAVDHRTAYLTRVQPRGPGDPSLPAPS